MNDSTGWLAGWAWRDAHMVECQLYVEDAELDGFQTPCSERMLNKSLLHGVVAPFVATLKAKLVTTCFPIS